MKKTSSLRRWLLRAPKTFSPCRYLPQPCRCV